MDFDKVTKIVTKNPKKIKGKVTKKAAEELERYRFIKSGNLAIRPRDAEYKDEEPEFQTYSPSLFVKNTFTIDPASPLQHVINMGLIIKKDEDVMINRDSFSEYQYFRPLQDKRTYRAKVPINHIKKPKLNENDCLKFAESMELAIFSGNMETVQNHLTSEESDPVLCIKDTEILFGNSDEENIEIYKEPVLRDNDAIPMPGESYAIVRREIMNSAPYHIAFVLYCDDDVNVTLEAEADAGKEYLPNFAFYDINSSGYTFHRRWSGELDDEDRKEALYSNGNTFVLSYNTKPSKTIIPVKSTKSKTKKSINSKRIKTQRNKNKK